jgi:hypothetical protein
MVKPWRAALGRELSKLKQLGLIEDALIETILNTSEAELRADMKARGEDPDKCLAEIDALIAHAKRACAHCRTLGLELHLLGNKWLCVDCLNDQLFWDKCEADRG